MMLNEVEAKALLAEYGIPVNHSYEICSVEEALGKWIELGTPVVLKVLSEKITHKSDLGLVALDLDSEEDIREVYDRIINKAREIDPEATAVIQSMAASGIEVIIGAKRDPQFGPTILFGIGGIFVEVFKDVSIRVAPVDWREAAWMINDIKGSTLLKGYRGKKPADTEAIINILMHVSDMMMARNDILEMDMNPVMVYEKGAVAVDARILINK